MLTYTESPNLIVKGLLFACENKGPLLVPLPIKKSITLPCHVGDIETAHWLHAGQIRPYFLDSVATHTSRKQLMSQFVVFYYRQRGGPANMRSNKLVNGLTATNDRAWYGDILVIKLKDEMVIDGCMEDVGLVKQLLRWYDYFMRLHYHACFGLIVSLQGGSRR